MRLLVAYTYYCLFLLILSCSWVGLVSAKTIEPADSHPENYCPLLAGKRVALIINQTSKAGDSLLLDLLLTRGIHVTKIFVPEHGFRGLADAGAHIDNTTDSATGLPVISLYGKHKKPLPEDISDIDIMVYDLQDVGARFYTYISTLQYCMEACAEGGKQFMVLDRPNPNGFYVDGPVLDTQCRSFVGMQPIPIVYGMTTGEYAKMLQGEKWFHDADKLDLRVIKCINYDHAQLYELPVPPSPNLRTMAAVLAYPSLCLFEGTVISVGRGTDLPFQQFGAPELAGKMADTFTPHSGPGAKSPLYEGKTCYGKILGSTAKDILPQTKDQIPLQWLIDAYNNYPDKDKFFSAFFVKLAGTSLLQEQIKKGMTEKEIRKSWEPGLNAFLKIRKTYLLYDDF